MRDKLKGFWNCKNNSLDYICSDFCKIILLIYVLTSYQINKHIDLKFDKWYQNKKQPAVKK